MAKQRNAFVETAHIIETIQNGPGVARIDVHITIIPRSPEQPAGHKGEADDLDQELAEFNQRHGQN